QRQMLAVADELQQRMQRPENQTRMNDLRQQVEQASEDMQRASEATGDGSVSQALASGTRAQRQLQETRDQLRRQSSSEFAEDLRELRSRARELEQQQQQISRDLSARATPERRTLGDPD